MTQIKQEPNKSLQFNSVIFTQQNLKQQLGY